MTRDKECAGKSDEDGCGGDEYGREEKERKTKVEMDGQCKWEEMQTRAV